MATTGSGIASVSVFAHSIWGSAICVTTVEIRILLFGTSDHKDDMVCGLGPRLALRRGRRSASVLSAKFGWPGVVILKAVGPPGARVEKRRWLVGVMMSFCPEGAPRVVVVRCWSVG